MKKTVDILLVENSTAGNLPKIFKAQTVEVFHELDAVLTGIDGRVSTGSYPSKVVWFGGLVSYLNHITDITITDTKDSVVLIDGTLNTNYGVPRNVDDTVIFHVLKYSC